MTLNLDHIFILLSGNLGEMVANSNQLKKADWRQIVDRYPLKPHCRQFIEDDKVWKVHKVNYVKLTIVPDGGISRMVLLGHIAKE